MPLSFDATGTCILIPTFSSYVPAALLTHTLLSRYWPGHPPIFFAGSNERRSPESWLPVRSDVTQWCSIVADACEDLAALGFARAYLILDDHPPINPCHDVHLNTTLPGLLDKYDATYIGLNGWGYGRPGRAVTGTVAPASDWNLEHVSSSFQWKFSLHPGLWSLEHLALLARSVALANPPEKRSAWTFERMANSPKLDAGFDYANGCYRVCGYRMTGSKARYFIHRAGYSSFLVYSRLLSRLAGRHCGGATLAALGCYYEGPYPLFWSGLIAQGRLNPALLEYVRLARRKDLQTLLSAAPMKPFSAALPPGG